MITSLALTVKQMRERPLHLSRCTLQLQGDHFEFVSHHPTTAEQEDDAQRQQQQQQDDHFVSRPNRFHIGSHRAHEPPPSTQTFVVRVFYQDIAKMEIFPEVFQVIVTTQSPCQATFVGPAAPSMPDRHTATVAQQHRKRFPKFPGVDDEEEVQDDDDDEEFVVTNGSRRPNQKSVSPAPRPQTHQQFEEALEHEQKLPRQQQLVSSSANTNPVVGHRTLGGVRRQYILLFKKEHIAEVWYKAMTEAVESWSELVMDGKRNAVRLAKLLKKRSAVDSGVEALEDEDDEDDDDDDDDLFTRKDVLDVEEAIATLGSEYHRNSLGWSHRKKQQQQQQQHKKRNNTNNNGTQQQRLHSSTTPTNLGRFLGTYGVRDEAHEAVQRQERVEDRRRRLVPMWEDVAALRDQIVNKIAHDGAIETPPPSSSSNKKRNQQQQQQPQDVDEVDDGDDDNGVADAYDPSPPRRAVARAPLLSTSLTSTPTPTAGTAPLLDTGTFVGNVAASSAPQQPDALLASRSPAPAPPAPAIAHRKQMPSPPPLLVAGRDVNTQLSQQQQQQHIVATPPPVPGPGVNSALPRSTTPPPVADGGGGRTPLISTGSGPVLPPPERKSVSVAA